jgi:hypothetical protein
MFRISQISTLILLFLLSCDVEPELCDEHEFDFTVEINNNSDRSFTFGFNFMMLFPDCVSPTDRYGTGVSVDPFSSVELQLGNVSVSNERRQGPGYNLNLQYTPTPEYRVTIPAPDIYGYNQYAITAGEVFKIEIENEPCESLNKEINVTAINRTDTAIWVMYNIPTLRFISCRPSENPTCRSYPCFGGFTGYYKVDPQNEYTHTQTSVTWRLDNWVIGNDPTQPGSEYTQYAPNPSSKGLIWGGANEDNQDSVFVIFDSIDDFWVSSQRPD